MNKSRSSSSTQSSSSDNDLEIVETSTTTQAEVKKEKDMSDFLENDSIERKLEELKEPKVASLQLIANSLPISDDTNEGEVYDLDDFDFVDSDDTII